jgi:hypothetical protein
MSLLQSSGLQFLTADGVVGASGKPVRVYSIHIISSGGGAAAVSLVNGTAAGTAVITETGTTSKGVTFSYGATGMPFPSGCFVDIDTNTTSVAVSFERMDA